MKACPNKKGQIADAAEVGLSARDSPYVCIYLRGRWQWQSIKNISGNTFKDVRKDMHKYIHKCLQEKILSEKQYNITISDCTTSSSSSINGHWRPFPDLVRNFGEFNIYKKGNRCLYCVKKTVDNTMKYEWWIGVPDNMNQRKGWGFLRQKTATTDSIPPWQVNKWLAWNMDDGENKWIEQPIKVEKMDKEWEIKKALEIKTRELAKQTQETIETCNAAVQQAHSMVDEHKEVSRELFNKLTKDERLALVDTSKFRAVFKKEDLCSCCFRDAKTTKCIHLDCTGACGRCRGDDKDADCCACGKKQVLECPICQGDNFPPSFMKIFGCKHCICYKCYSTAYELNRQIKKCPMCRVPID